MPVTNDVSGRAQLGAVLRKLGEPVCCFCDCTGDTCKTATGEKCELITESIVRRRCTGVACMHAEARYQNKVKRGRNRAPRGSRPRPGMDSTLTGR